MFRYVPSFYWAGQQMNRFGGGHMKMMSQSVMEFLELLFVTENMSIRNQRVSKLVIDDNSAVGLPTYNITYWP